MKKTVLILSAVITLLAVTSCGNKKSEQGIVKSEVVKSSVDTPKIVPATGLPIILADLYCKNTEHDCVIEYTEKGTGTVKKMEVRQFWLNNLHRYDYDYRPASLQYFMTYFVPKDFDLNKVKKGEKGYYLTFENIGVPIKRTYKEGQERFLYGIREQKNGKSDTVRMEEAYVLLQ